MKSAYALIIIAFILLAHVVSAIPTTQDPAFKNSSTILFYATGCACPCYYKYGTVSGNYVWRTENQSNASALNYIWEKGSPLLGNQTYYYKACDSTGCGAEKNTRLTNVTPAPTVTFGGLTGNITRSHFDIAVIGSSILEPYTWVTYNPNITVGILLFFVFTGLWMRQREVVIPILLGFIASGLLIYQGTNSVGIPPEMLIIVVGLVTVALAGVVFGLFKR